MQADLASYFRTPLKADIGVSNGRVGDTLGGTGEFKGLTNLSSSRASASLASGYHRGDNSRN
jgi:predicted butyrate kinase (DUF1464 family)